MIKLNGSKALPERLLITDGMNWEEIDNKGNEAQKQSRIIFDGDGNGKYSKIEANVFNNTRTSVQTEKNGVTTVKVYKKQGNKLVATVVLDNETRTLYDNLHSKQGALEELTNILKHFGSQEDLKQLKNLQKEIVLLQEQFQQKTKYNEICMNILN